MWILDESLEWGGNYRGKKEKSEKLSANILPFYNYF